MAVSGPALSAVLLEVFDTSRSITGMSLSATCVHEREGTVSVSVHGVSTSVTACVHVHERA